jgi:hypothetical protein
MSGIFFNGVAVAKDRAAEAVLRAAEVARFQVEGPAHRLHRRLGVAGRQVADDLVALRAPARLAGEVIR